MKDLYKSPEEASEVTQDQPTSDEPPSSGGKRPIELSKIQ